MELLNTRMLHYKINRVSGLASHMDIILLNKKCIIYNKLLNGAKTIFINTRLYNTLINVFIDKILPKLTNPITLIISGEDYTFPNNNDKRIRIRNNRVKTYKHLGNHKMIRKIFVENLDQSICNAEPIPLGVNPRDCKTDLKYYLKYQNINDNKPLLITNFNKCRDGKGQWAERKKVLRLCNTCWKKNSVNNPLINNYEEYLTTLGSYLFTVCVHGGGLDVNPKLWEALLLGVIPIIRENKPYTDLYKKHNLPVVIVKKWNKYTITKKKLKGWYNQYYHYFTDNDKRKKLLDTLTLNYWVKYISDDK
jgi:hypothetical protein